MRGGGALFIIICCILFSLFGGVGRGLVFVVFGLR